MLIFLRKLVLDVDRMGKKVVINILLNPLCTPRLCRTVVIAKKVVIKKTDAMWVSEMANVEFDHQCDVKEIGTRFLTNTIHHRSKYIRRVPL
jgi:hypothetical protein